MIRRVQTKHLIRPHGMDPTKELFAGEQLELVVEANGNRRDVVVRRPNCADYLIYDGNIAGLEVESILPEFAPAAHDTLPPSSLARQQPSSEPDADYQCPLCVEPKTFLTPRALQGHMSRVHRESLKAAKSIEVDWPNKEPA